MQERLHEAVSCRIVGGQRVHMESKVLIIVFDMSRGNQIQASRLAHAHNTQIAALVPVLLLQIT